MARPIGIDQLNNLIENSNSFFLYNTSSMGEDDTSPSTLAEEEDAVLELLIMSYVFGTNDGALMLGLVDDTGGNSIFDKNIGRNAVGKDVSKDINISKMQKSIYQPIEGKTWAERLASASTKGEKKRIAETEAYRVYNQAVYDKATESGKGGLEKTWHTMRDERVRDSHSYLDGTTVGLNEKFYTYDGDSALYPHGFAKPEEDINCRCYITIGQGRPKSQEVRED